MLILRGLEWFNTLAIFPLLSCGRAGMSLIRPEFWYPASLDSETDLLSLLKSTVVALDYPSATLVCALAMGEFYLSLVYHPNLHFLIDLHNRVYPSNRCPD